MLHHIKRFFCHFNELRIVAIIINLRLMTFIEEGALLISFPKLKTYLSFLNQKLLFVTPHVIFVKRPLFCINLMGYVQN